MGNPQKKMTMDQHTQQKVGIYDAYLRRYLKIILNSGFPKISIFDPFAGMGKYGDIDGSALVACKNIISHRAFCRKKNISLYLNEPNDKNRESLESVCNFDFVKQITDMDANKFISIATGKNIEGHKLWFLDPYGYTQIERSSINRIMKQNNTELLLFIPLTFIYRFLNGHLGTDNRLQPIVEFLRDYNIDESEARKCVNPIDFAVLIAKKLQKQYGYSWHATMQEGANCYSLFFISGHIYGLEKFLEARDKILKDNENVQLTLIPMGEERDLLRLIPKGTPIDNCELYELGLNNGYTPASVRKALEVLESQQQIHVIQLGDFVRRKGWFFIGNKYYRNNDHRICVELMFQQGMLI